MSRNNVFEVFMLEYLNRSRCIYKVYTFKKVFLVMKPESTHIDIPVMYFYYVYGLREKKIVKQLEENGLVGVLDTTNGVREFDRESLNSELTDIFIRARDNSLSTWMRGGVTPYCYAGYGIVLDKDFTPIVLACKRINKYDNKQNVLFINPRVFKDPEDPLSKWVIDCVLPDSGVSTTGCLPFNARVEICDISHLYKKQEEPLCKDDLNEDMGQFVYDNRAMVFNSLYMQ